MTFTLHLYTAQCLFKVQTSERLPSVWNRRDLPNSYLMAQASENASEASWVRPRKAGRRRRRFIQHEASRGRAPSASRWEWALTGVLGPHPTTQDAHTLAHTSCWTDALCFSWGSTLGKFRQTLLLSIGVIPQPTVNKRPPGDRNLGVRKL